jgi:hypothetical protein
MTLSSLTLSNFFQKKNQNDSMVTSFFSHIILHKMTFHQIFSNLTPKKNSIKNNKTTKENNSPPPKKATTTTNKTI